MLCQLALDVLSCMQGYCKEVKDVAEGGGFGVVQSFPVSPVIVMSSHSVIAKALQLQGVHTHWSFVCIIL